MKRVPEDILMKLKAVTRRIEMAASFDGETPDAFAKSTSLETLTRIAGMSERSLRDWFKEFTGEGIGKYASRRRTEYAARLFRLFPETSKAEASRIIGLSTSHAFYPFMKKQGVENIDGLRGKYHPVEDNMLLYRIEKLPESVMFYTLEDVLYKECSAPKFEVENWDKIERHVKEKFPDAVKLGDVGFAIDNYIENKLEEGFFMSGIIYRNISATNLSEDLNGDIGWRHFQGRKYAVFIHEGDYGNLSEFYFSALYTLRQSPDIQIEKSLLIMEKYLNSPTDTPAEELKTEIWIPLTNS